MRWSKAMHDFSFVITIWLSDCNIFAQVDAFQWRIDRVIEKKKVALPSVECLWRASKQSNHCNSINIKNDITFQHYVRRKYCGGAKKRKGMLEEKLPLYFRIIVERRLKEGHKPNFPKCIWISACLWQRRSANEKEKFYRWMQVVACVMRPVNAFRRTSNKSFIHKCNLS